VVDTTGRLSRRLRWSRVKPEKRTVHVAFDGEPIEAGPVLSGTSHSPIV